MPNQALLLKTLVELADNLVENFDIVDLLSLLSDRCVDALDVAAAGVMLASSNGTLEVLASSNHAMHTLELFQLQAREGPCLEAYETGKPVVNIDLAGAATEWPLFASKATEAGFYSAHSIPLRLRGQVLGALNMLHTEAGPFGDTDVAVAQAFADVAAIALIQHQFVLDAHALNDQLSVALDSRVAIEQAKGKISQATDVDLDRAFRRLRAHARNHNIRLSDLADQIAGGSLAVTDLDPL